MAVVPEERAEVPPVLVVEVAVTADLDELEELEELEDLVVPVELVELVLPDVPVFVSAFAAALFTSCRN